MHSSLNKTRKHYFSYWRISLSCPSPALLSLIPLYFYGIKEREKPRGSTRSTVSYHAFRLQQCVKLLNKIHHVKKKKEKKKRPQKPIHCLSWKVKKSPQGCVLCIIRYISGLNKEEEKKRINRKM